MIKTTATFVGTNVLVSTPIVDEATNMVLYTVTCPRDTVVTVTDPVRDGKLTAMTKKMKLELLLQSCVAQKLSRRDVMFNLTLDMKLPPTRAAEIYQEFKSNGNTLFPELLK